MTDSAILTIPLTNRAPVEIREDDWPVIAHCSVAEQDGASDSESQRSVCMDLWVRERANGRVLVHACYEFLTVVHGERDLALRAGELVDNAYQVPAAIRRVAATIEAGITRRLDPPRFTGRSRGAWPVECDLLAQQCIASLPAKRI